MEINMLSNVIIILGTIVATEIYWFSHIPLTTAFLKWREFATMIHHFRYFKFSITFGMIPHFDVDQFCTVFGALVLCELLYLPKNFRWSHRAKVPRLGIHRMYEEAIHGLAFMVCTIKSFILSGKLIGNCPLITFPQRSKQKVLLKLQRETELDRIFWIILTHLTSTHFIYFLSYTLFYSIGKL